MSKTTALRILLSIGIAGMLFSGYLSYTELWGNATTSCPSLGGASGTILGYPACVYGFVMYIAIVIVAAFGLRSREV